MGFHAVKNTDITVRGIGTDQINSLARTRRMAKPEHLAKLEESVEDWNMWRYDNPEIVPAFWGADLEEADLRGAYLNSADLREAKLRDADLKGANLERANLMEASLKRTNLEGTNLKWAMYLQARQLCETNTLYQAILDLELEREVRKERPHLFDKPKEKLRVV